jgi:hypothetical protein
MHRPLLAAALLLAAARPASAAGPPTMRVDYYHTGNATEERFSLDRVVVEPLPWPGNPARPIDTTNRGNYFFEVVDNATGRIIFSRGFSSIYGEWETTRSRDDVPHVFQSLRFPLVEAGADRLRKRDARTSFAMYGPSRSIRPTSSFSVARRRHRRRLIKLLKAAIRAKLDLLMLGDGFRRASGASSSATPGLVGVLLATSPFRRRRDINIWGLSPASPQSGINGPPSTSSSAHRSGRPTTPSTQALCAHLRNHAFRDIAKRAYDVVESS